MKKFGNLANFVKNYETDNKYLVTEAGRGRPKKNKDTENLAEEPVNKLKGVDADKNGSGGTWGLCEPYDDEAMKEIDLNNPENTDSLKDLIAKFDSDEDFFVIGEAGWAKTTLIRKLAQKYGKLVLTVYLDKVEKEELGGWKVPVKDENGSYMKTLMPDWAQFIHNNPDKDFLLFFDELNQADPMVMTALMPIVLDKTICGVKFKNYIVGAAGNFEWENASVNELPTPLKKRFDPIITWETGTPRAWNATFNDYLHKRYDPILGKDLVDAFHENASIFYDPRAIENQLFKFAIKIKKRAESTGDLGRNSASLYLRRIIQLSKPEEELNREQKNAQKKLAEMMAKWIGSTGKEGSDSESTSSGRRRSKNEDMISEEDMEDLKKCITQGFAASMENGKMRRYGVARENVMDIFPDDWNGEMIKRVLKNLERSGVKFKYEKRSEWEKMGYEDPNAE